MVVHDLDPLGAPVLPDEADPPPVVDPDGVLPGAVPAKGLEPVARRHPQVVEPAGGVEHDQLPVGPGVEVRREGSRALPAEQPLRVGAAEAADHSAMLTHGVHNARRYGADGLRLQRLHELRRDALDVRQVGALAGEEGEGDVEGGDAGHVNAGKNGHWSATDP